MSVAPQVDEFAVGAGADHVNAFVHASPIAEKIFLCCPVILASKRYALHAGRWLQSSQADGSWSQINKRDKTIGDFAAGIISGSQLSVFGRYVQ